MEVLERLCILCLLLLKLSYVTKVLAAAMSVCPGGQLNLTCSTDEMILIWTITFPHSPVSEERFVLTTGVIEPLTESLTMFQFLRTSASPLTSVMMIENINFILNGTRVECSDHGGVISTDIIDVIGNVKCASPFRLLTDKLVTANYRYPAIEGTVAMFSCSSSGYVLTGPSRATCTRNGEWVPDPRQVQCEAIECGSPSVNMNVSTRYNSTLFNARLTLTCAEGLLPSGVPTALCHSNGSWTPDPTDFTCNSAMSSDHEPERVNQNLIIAAAVITSIIVAVVLFLLGYASGWFGHKYKDTIQARSDKTSNSQPAPLYEDLQPTSTSEDQEKAFELKENVAYGPVRAT